MTDAHQKSCAHAAGTCISVFKPSNSSRQRSHPIPVPWIRTASPALIKKPVPPYGQKKLPSYTDVTPPWINFAIPCSLVPTSGRIETSQGRVKSRQQPSLAFVQDRLRFSCNTKRPVGNQCGPTGGSMTCVPMTCVSICAAGKWRKKASSKLLIIMPPRR